MNISCCGLVCDECEFYQKSCTGCISVKGQTFWAKQSLPNSTCPLFDCAVNRKNYNNCGACNELPCQMFRTMKDPNSSDEEHLKSLERRTTLLKEINKN